MEIAELIRQLYEESGQQIRDYAETIRSSVTQLSNVLNGSQPGSVKMLETCLQKAGKRIEDCLQPPGKMSEEEDALVGKLLFILRNDADGRRGISINIDYIYEEARRRVRRRARSVQKKDDRPPPAKQRHA